MRQALLLLMLTSCVYVTKQDFMEHWDADGDGWPVGEDCDDSNPHVYPYAPDFRGDGCDADCASEPDADGDDWPDSVDCDPDDPEIFPCSPHEVEGDGIDHDCDGRDGVRTQPCQRTDPDFEETPELDAESCQPVSSSRRGAPGASW